MRKRESTSKEQRYWFSAEKGIFRGKGRTARHKNKVVISNERRPKFHRNYSADPSNDVVAIGSKKNEWKNVTM